MNKIRLGPIAIFLCIVAAALSVLAALTVSTAHADLVLAERFAHVTQIRYELESRGNRFLRDVDDALASGADASSADGAVLSEDGGYTFTAEVENYTLTVSITEPDADGSYEITAWRMTRIWEADDPLDDIWMR